MNKFNKELVSLYKKKQNNKIYEWSIELLYENDLFYSFVKHGVLNGKQIEHKKEVIPKAKRNVFQQYELESKRKISDKIEKEGYTLNLNSILINEENKNVGNTENILIRPMLAQTFDKSKYELNKKCKKITFPCYGQPKFDGIRCIMYNKNDKITMESRKGTQFYNFNNLKEEFKNTLLKEENVVFDGELYSFNIVFEKLNGLVRLKKPKEHQICEINSIEYYIYDIIDLTDLNATYEKRKQKIEKISKKYNFNLIKFCPTINIESYEDVDEYHNNFVNNGFEGLILRNKNGNYEINKRSYDLQKYKKFMDEEFTIVSYTQGSGDEKGLIIFICETKDKKKFNVRPRGTRDYRRQLYNNGNNLINKKLTVIFQEYSNDGIPRFPVGKGIRIDKN